MVLRLPTYTEFLNESITRKMRESSIVKQDDVPEIWKRVEEDIFPGLRLRKNDWTRTGSAGKRGDSNSSKDVDYAISRKALISRNNISEDGVKGFLESHVVRFGMESSINESSDGFSLLVGMPKKKGNAIVNFELVENIEWSKFARYSPNYSKGESKYDQRYRTNLLEAIVAVTNKRILEYSDNRDNIESYESKRFDVRKGIVSEIYTFQSKYGTMKRSRHIDEQDEIDTNDPVEFVDSVFEGLKPSDILTFESLLENYNSKAFKYPKLRKHIESKFQHLCSKSRLEPIELN